MTLQETAKHFRKRLSHEGIKARCQIDARWNMIRIYPPTFDASFSETEQRTIRLIAQCSHLTRSRGMAIDLEQMTDSKEAVFAYGFC